MARRVLLITQWFDPEPTFKGLVFAQELMKEGFDVEVVTGFPNYPGGKVYPGYKISWRQREVMEGVQVTRLWLYPSHDGSAVRRALNYFSFFISATLYGVFSARKADAIYAYHPPLTTGLAAILIKFFRRTPLVVDIQDLWPDTLRATGMLTNGLFLKAVGTACLWMYRRADHIVVLSQGFRGALIARGVPKTKIDVIYNWANEKSITAAVSRQRPDGFLPGRFNILFAGNMGRAQALDSVLEAASLTQETAPQIQFIFIGGGLEVTNLRTKAAKIGLSNVTFLPGVPMAEVGSRLAAADALLVHLRRDPLFKITIPSKTQAYMAAGRPIIMAVQGDAADLVSKADCGVLATPEDAVSIGNAAICLASASDQRQKELATNAAKFYQEYLSVGVGVRRFAILLRSLIRPD